MLLYSCSYVSNFKGTHQHQSDINRIDRTPDSCFINNELALVLMILETPIFCGLSPIK